MSGSLLLIVLPIVLLLLLALLIWWFMSSRSRGDDAARVEAQALRDQAAAHHEPTLAAQETYAVQAAERESWAAAEAERAEVAAEEARVQADEAAERAAAAAADAEAGRAQLLQSEEAYAADLHRADVIDPDTDVTEEDFAGVAASEEAEAADVEDASFAPDASDASEASDAAELADGVDGPAASAVSTDGHETPLSESTISTPMFLEVARAHDLAADEVISEPSGAAAAGATPSAWGDAETTVEPVMADAPLVEEEAVAPESDSWSEPDRAEEVAAEAAPVESAPIESDEAPVGDGWAAVDEPAATEDVTTEPERAEAEGDGEHTAYGNDLDGHGDDVDGDAGPAQAEIAEPVDAGSDWQHDEAMMGEEAAHAMPSEAPETEAWGRRISDLDEVTDGGFGVGSAAPISDGAQPLGHPVQAYFDSRTYRTAEHPGYDSCEPDVWFFDAESAQRAGFSSADN